MTATPDGAPWLTVVTVVKDDDSGLRQTAESVAQQDMDGVEYLVIDGSTDRAAAPRVLASSEVAGRVVWSSPRGIYDAMNVALAEAEGTYVLYMNAGDTFVDPTVLGRLRSVVQKQTPRWLFGRVIIVGTDGSEVVTPRWDYVAEKAALFSNGLFPPHQGTVAQRSLLLSMDGFDTTYRVAADYAAFLRMSQVSDPVQVDLVIARFVEGGTSTLNWRASFREFHRARRAILRPKGATAWRERYASIAHFAKVFAYREVIRRARR